MSAEFLNLYSKANEAGMAAAEACVPAPMVVSGMGKSYYVPDGVCGFAWVKIRPANSKFANWLKANKLARNAYGGGVDIWIGAYNQSMMKKEAHARAMAEVLRDAGIAAYADSRMD